MMKFVYLCCPLFRTSLARVAELVDASVSKTDERKFVPVRFRPRVLVKALLFARLFDLCSFKFLQTLLVFQVQLERFR